MKNSLNRSTLMGLASWAKFRKFRRPYGTELGMVVFTQTLEPRILSMPALKRLIKVLLSGSACSSASSPRMNAGAPTKNSQLSALRSFFNQISGPQGAAAPNG